MDISETESIEDFDAQRIHFLDLLEALTNAGRVEWLRSEFDPGFVYCSVDGDDLIIFECMGGGKGDEPISPTERLAGVVSHYCNTTYLWLPVSANWDLLLRLLRSSKVDEDRFIESRRIANRAPVKVLKAKLKK